MPVDTLFSYGIPPRLVANATPGKRALVPFGTRRLVGTIVSCAPFEPGAGEAPLRALLRVIDDEPMLSADMLRILRDAAHEVFCPVGLAYASAVPTGSAPRAVRGYELTTLGATARESGAARPELRPLLEALRDGPRPLRALERRGGDVVQHLEALRRDGLVRTLALETGAVRTPQVRVASLAPGVDVGEALTGPLARAPRQAALLRALAKGGAAEVPALRGSFPGCDAALRALAGRGLVVLESRPVDRRPPPSALADTAATPPTLTGDQERALLPILEALRAPRFERFLLHGVTGSGKTEVYLRAVANAIARGRQALVLVPEITLTHQLVARLHARFGEQVAVLHSGLRPGERVAEWRKLQAGDTPIAVGARSALFAPLARLGLIVIDEEHDHAYKNEEGFRYHARDLAARRAAAAECPLVLGSATPALETRHAADQGEVRRLSLPHRIGNRPLPAVEMVDLAAERALLPRGRKLVLSRLLHDALAETLSEGGQAILFLNRRGFSTRVFCFECGHAERCEHCDISLVYHAGEHFLRCHYCDYGTAPPETCSHCGAPETALLGIGTERLEEEVRRLFPGARVARLDRDTAARRGETERVLGELGAGRLDVLIGTQMVAKGHHFPGVRLVGIVAADLTLHFPDFRASERTFQLLTQVAGRAGRGAAPGRVVVQTFAPDHYALRPVRDHDYERFYRDELRQRAALGYPPFGRLVQVLVSGPDESETLELARALAEIAHRHLAGVPAAPVGAPAALEVLGPAAAPLARLRDRYRFHLLIKGSDEKRVLAVGRELAEHAEGRRPGGKLRIQVDPNPVNML